MFSFFQRLICWVIEKAITAQEINGIRLYDLRTDSDRPPAVIFVEAMKQLRNGGKHFEELVVQEISMVVLSSFAESIAPPCGAYYTRLPGRENSDPVYLASRLVWVARFIREYQHMGADRHLDRSRLERVSTREQIEFLDAVGEEAAWSESVRKRALEP